MEETSVFDEGSARIYLIAWYSSRGGYSVHPGHSQMHLRISNAVIGWIRTMFLIQLVKTKPWFQMIEKKSNLEGWETLTDLQCRYRHKILDFTYIIPEWNRITANLDALDILFLALGSLYFEFSYTTLYNWKIIKLVWKFADNAVQLFAYLYTILHSYRI